MAGQWQAVYAPRGLPPEIAERIRAESARFLNAAETRKRFAVGFLVIAPGCTRSAAAPAARPERVLYGPGSTRARLSFRPSRETVGFGRDGDGAP